MNIEDIPEEVRREAIAKVKAMGLTGPSTQEFMNHQIVAVIEKIIEKIKTCSDEEFSAMMDEASK